MDVEPWEPTQTVEGTGGGSWGGNDLRSPVGTAVKQNGNGEGWCDNE